MVSYCRTVKETAIFAKESLESVNAKIIGCVFNRVKADSYGNRGYYRRYGSKYGYRYGYKRGYGYKSYGYKYYGTYGGSYGYGYGDSEQAAKKTGLFKRL
jgi:Mrp family chromosome partitioning ATPase